MRGLILTANSCAKILDKLRDKLIGLTRQEAAGERFFHHVAEGETRIPYMTHVASNFTESHSREQSGPAH